MHCGTCSSLCSVAPVFQKILNENILPSEKLVSLKSLSNGKPIEKARLRAIQEGSFICTDCLTCTQVCPAGINLQDLWNVIKEDLTEKGFPELQTWAREAGSVSVAAVRNKILDNNDRLCPEPNLLRNELSLSDQADTFASCFKCQNCTVVCPVVWTNNEDPQASLDLVPHQIMLALSLGLKDMVLGSRMIWDCVTCYLCQEQCPQGVKVTDVLYELKNLAYEQLKSSDQKINKDKKEAEATVEQTNGGM